MDNTIREQLYRDCTIILASTLLGTILNDPKAGGVGGTMLVLGIHTLPAIIKNKSQTSQKQSAWAFNYSIDVNRRGWLRRPLSEFLGKRTIAQPSPSRPLFLDQRMYGSCTHNYQPYIISDDDLYRVFNAINRVSDPDRNLSYRELVGRRRVHRMLFEAFWNLLRFTEWYTNVHLIVQPRHQWYSLAQSPNTVRALFSYVEHQQRGRGRGADSMRRLPSHLQ